MAKERTCSRRPAAWRLVIATGIMLVAARASMAETLSEAIAMAYQSNPTLQQQRAQLRALDESYVQAMDGYHPTANLQVTVTTDTNNANSSLVNLPGASQQLTPGQSQTSSAAIVLSQPVYTGGRVATQVNAAEASILAGRETLRATEQSILQSVIAAYLDVRRDQQAVTIDEENIRLLSSRLDETQARFDAGQITRTDVAQTQTNIFAARAQLSAARAQLAVSRASYAQVVGQDPGDLAPEPSLDRSLPTSLQQALDMTQSDSPQVRQSRYAEAASAARVATARAQTRPSLALQASLGYVGGQNGLGSPFVDYSHDVSVSAVAVFPIFTGGTTSSQIRQATETNTGDKIGIEIARRQAAFNVTQAWSQLENARASVGIDEAQVQAATVSEEGYRLEAKAGLRSTLDVLIIEQNFTNAKLALNVARHDEYVAGANLLALMGALTTDVLAADVPRYDPRANFNKVRKDWPWAPWTPAVSTLDHIGVPPVEKLPDPHM